MDSFRPAGIRTSGSHFGRKKTKAADLSAAYLSSLDVLGLLRIWKW
jgi:hypothetical protein